MVSDLKKNRILLLLLISFQAALAQAPQLDSALAYLHDHALFNGTVLLAENGKVVYQKNYGITDNRNPQPLQVSSAFNLASISKQFVCAMVCLLQENGRLGFDDQVQKHLPEFPYPTVTVRQLMNHTSGVPEYFDLSVRYTGALDTLDNQAIMQLLAELKPPLDFTPGEKWQYSNTGYVVLGSLIEQLSGKSIADYFTEKITRPLGLKNTYIFNLKMKTSPQNRVIGFKREDGKNKQDDLMRFDGIVGDGNVYSSAEDLLKWTQALHGGKLLKPATYAEMRKPAPLNDGTTHPYGFGIGFACGNCAVHTGGWVGFLNLLWTDFDKNRTLVVLSSGGSPAGLQAGQQFMKGEKITLPQTQLIENVQLVDGSGSPARRASVRLMDDRIWEIGDLKPFQNEPVYDGKGQVLAPGFIDTHSHHFWALDEDPSLLPALSQGITTIITGQDGSSEPMDSIEAAVKRQPISINVASYTGHTSLRLDAMGMAGFRRHATAAEVEKMKASLKSELEKGSLGLCTGLEYERAFYSNRDEVLALAKIAGEAGGRYMSHIRSEDIHIEDAIDEIINIGREAKLPVQVSHIKVAMKSKWESSRGIVAAMQAARAQGIDITADCYPYDFWHSTLKVLFPNRDYDNLASAEFACRELFDPAQSRLSAFLPNPSYKGKTVAEVARLRNETPAQTLVWLIAEADRFDGAHPDAEGNTEAIMGKSMLDTDIANFIAWPHTNICSDGAPTSHPRGHGAFPRILAKYVRQEKLLPLETAIQKMTSLCAEHTGIQERGLVANGFFADLVLFDPATVQDNATADHPTALSSGITAVWVNGQLVFEGGKATGVRAGVVVRR
ncbi:MAG: serine hydrolase [Saprospiraceae bacterium]|nr:serine hydrolase [Saprospiraceae bacterium]